MKKLLKSVLLLMLSALVSVMGTFVYADDEQEDGYVNAEEAIEPASETELPDAEPGEPDEISLMGDSSWKARMIYDIDNTSIAVRSTSGLQGLEVNDSYYGAPLKDSSDGVVRYYGQSARTDLDENWHGQGYLELSPSAFTNIKTSKVVLEYDILCTTNKTGLYFRCATPASTTTRTSFPFIRSGLEFNVGEWTKIDLVMGNVKGDTDCDIYVNGKFLKNYKMVNYGVAGTAWLHPYVPDKQYVDMYIDNIKIIAADSMREYIPSQISPINTEYVITDGEISGVEYGAFAEDVISGLNCDDTIFFADQNANIVDSSMIVDDTMKLVTVSSDELYSYYTVRLKYLYGDVDKKIALIRNSSQNVIAFELKSIQNSTLAVFANKNGTADGKVYFYPVDPQTDEHSFELEQAAQNKFAISAFCINSVPAFSNIKPADDISFDLAVESGMTISGQAEAGSDVIMFVTDPGKTFDPSVLASETTSEDIYTVIGTTADSEGNFVFDTVQFENSGIYQYVILKDRNVYSKSEFAPGKEKIIEFKQSLKTLGSASELAQILNADAPIGDLGFDYTYYTKLSQSQREFVCGEVIELMGDLASDNLSLDDFAFRFKYLSAICAVPMDWGDGSQPAANIYKVLDTRNEIFGLSGSSVDSYNNMTSDQKYKVCGYIHSLGKGIDSPESFGKVFDISVINCELDGYYTHNDVANILKSHKDLLDGLNFDDYADLTSKFIDANDAILKARPYSDTEALVNKANSEILKAHSEEKEAAKEGKKSSGGGGGGSGKKGTGISSSTPLTSIATSVETQNVFTDLATVPWAQEAINVLFKHGIVSGRGEGIFDPDNTITREEFVKMIVQAKKLDSYTAENEFKDVDKTKWYSRYISIAKENGLVNGIDEENFGVGMNITRQDMMVMCSKLLDSTATGVNITSFGDYEDISDYARDAVSKLVGLGIVSGDGNGNILPRDFCTRAQAAKVIYLLMQAINN